jgi:hypothetical protein
MMTETRIGTLKRGAAEVSRGAGRKSIGDRRESSCIAGRRGAEEGAPGLTLERGASILAGPISESPFHGSDA